MNIAKNIRKKMGERNINQKQLARATGVSEATICHWLKGRDILTGNFISLAKALNCSCAELIK